MRRGLPRVGDPGLGIVLSLGAALRVPRSLGWGTGWVGSAYHRRGLRPVATLGTRVREELAKEMPTIARQFQEDFLAVDLLAAAFFAGALLARVFAALRAAAERSSGPLVRAALRAAAERSAAVRFAAADFACLESALCEAAE